MHSRQKLVVHRGKNVIVHDYQGISDEDFPLTVRQLTKELMADTTGATLLLLDITGCTISKNVLFEFKTAAVEAKAKVTKTAVVGVEGIQLFFLNIVNIYSSIGAEPRATQQEALDYLVS